jgi:hypothetical protein
MIDRLSFLSNRTSFLALCLMFLAQSAFAQTSTFTVNKTYDDGTDAAVMITAVCTGGGSFDANPLPASPGNPAVFTYRGYTGDPTCTADEPVVPIGYTANMTDCSDNDPIGGS